MCVPQGRINLSGQSVQHSFGGASTIFTVKTDDLLSRRSFNTLQPLYLNDKL